MLIFVVVFCYNEHNYFLTQKEKWPRFVLESYYMMKLEFNEFEVYCRILKAKQLWPV